MLAAMTMPFALPAWVPWWVPLLVLLPALLLGLAFLAMPFSVFGVKARLELVEARLDEIQEEIRRLALRLPERGAAVGYEELPDPARYRRPPFGARPAAVAQPPIPPRHEPEIEDEPDLPRVVRPGARRAPEPDSPPPRSEPRLDWPR
jgi:hypothetical protein